MKLGIVIMPFHPRDRTQMKALVRMVSCEYLEDAVL
jgi:hypothetical protein